MNIRKLSSVLEYMVLGLVAYQIIKSPENIVTYSTYLFGLVAVIETVLFGLEYFRMARKGKLTLINRRLTFSLHNIVRITFWVIIIWAAVKNWGSIDINSTNGLLFSIVSGLRNGIFNEQKTRIRLDSERLLFQDLLNRDIWLSEVQDFKLDEKEHILTLELMGGTKKVIKIKKEGKEEDEELRDEIITRMKSIPRMAYSKSN
ncbi:MAG: hypothetical protein AAFN93_05670 [Bacteroidota bacterium]